jgi:hypothetical protein
MHRYNNSNNFINYSEHTDHSNNFQNLRQNYFLEYTENFKQININYHQNVSGTVFQTVKNILSNI